MRTFSMARKPALLPAGALLALLLASCAPAAAAGGGLSATPVETTHVEMPRSYLFDPAVIKVPVGATVTWHNGDNFTHSVFMQDGTGRNPIAPPGQSVSLTFDKPGDYAYVCSFHPQNMKGRIVVGG